MMGFDVDGAYLQSPRRGPPCWAVLPAALLPSAVRARTQGMRCPVYRLDRALYGEVDAGSDWT